MNGEALSAALSGLPEAMIAEAMTPQRKSHVIPWLRLAACIALIAAILAGSLPYSNEIVTAPGILMVMVYAEGNGDCYESVKLETGVTFPCGSAWHPGTNAVPGLPVTLLIVEPDFRNSSIQFEISIDGGCFIRLPDSESRGFLDTYNGQPILYPDNFTVGNCSTIYWLENGSIDFDGDIAYVDIVIYQEDNIVGYAVLRIDRVYDPDCGRTNSFCITLVDSVAFSKIGGHYQNVPESYVRNRIEEVKRDK